MKREATSSPTRLPFLGEEFAAFMNDLGLEVKSIHHVQEKSTILRPGLHPVNERRIAS